jgi:hypothetical protein
VGVSRLRKEEVPNAVVTLSRKGSHQSHQERNEVGGLEVENTEAPAAGAA